VAEGSDDEDGHLTQPPAKPTQAARPGRPVPSKRSGAGWVWVNGALRPPRGTAEGLVDKIPKDSPYKFQVINLVPTRGKFSACRKANIQLFDPSANNDPSSLPPPVLRRDNRWPRCAVTVHERYSYLQFFDGRRKQHGACIWAGLYRGHIFSSRAL
jgi:hypothetical protein